jgi:hypothetical protein
LTSVMVPILNIVHDLISAAIPQQSCGAPVRLAGVIAIDYD